MKWNKAWVAQKHETRIKYRLEEGRSDCTETSSLGKSFSIMRVETQRTGNSDITIRAGAYTVVM